MSTRNPIRGKRRPIQAGDRCTYEVPAGPPAEAIAQFGGDAQSAITAALTLLWISLRGGQVQAPTRLEPAAAPEASQQQESGLDPAVLSQDFG